MKKGSGLPFSRDINVQMQRWSVAFSMLLLVGAILFASDSSAQTAIKTKGWITGSVVDAETGEPLIGANVVIEGTMMGAAADINGNYKILHVPPGTHTLLIMMMGYTKTTVTDVVVKAGEVTRIDAAAKSEVLQAEEVVVTAKAIRNTEALLLKDRQKAKAVSDAISSEAISRAASGNAAEAMKQITGASVVDGKYVFVRGLGDRYTSTQLNGAEIPSTDPYKRAGSVDLIPTNLVDNIVTVKSFTPDKPGNFSGGTVNIETKDFPEKLNLSLSVSSSYNTQTTFKNNVLTYQGGGTDWLGMDDGQRAVPDVVGDDIQIIDVGAAGKDANLAYTIDRYTKAFSNTMTPSESKPPLNQSYALSIGNQFDLFNRPLGYLASLTYKRNYSSYDDGEYNRWGLEGHDSTKAALENTFRFIDHLSQDEVLWGGVLKMSYRVNPLSVISLNALYNQNGESTARFLEGSYPYDIDQDWVYQTRVLQYKERNLANIQLNGDRHLPSLWGMRLNLRASYSMSTQDEPDLRYFYNYETPEGQYGIKSNLAPERYFRFMDEEHQEYAVDISLPFKQWQGLAGTMKMGATSGSKHREFTERRFSYQPVNKIGTYFRQANGDVDALFDESNLGVVGTRVAPNGNTYYSFGLYIAETDQSSSNYTGDQDIDAIYLMLDLPLTQKLRFITGARYETTDMTVKSQNPLKPEGEIKTKDVLPSVNLIYNLIENMNIRFAYGRTLARPTFREISSFSSFDFNGGDTFIGNPDLERTLIDNFDLRWEWFSRPGELYAVSGFYKKFTNPIETVILDVNYMNQWQNVDEAIVFGMEIEARKQLDVLYEKLSNFSLGGNLSLIHSRVDVSPEELVKIRSMRPDADDTRPFQGQSPYLLNLTLNYDHLEKGIGASLYYNIFGERLSAIGRSGTPDVYEQPASMLNFTFSKRLTSRISMKISATNLLDSKEKKLHEYKGQEFIYSSYNKGRTISLGAKYDL
ncbi:TonB-dependent receptor [candidate division KSB1 bacterium]|nr:TonB-dependent receptor [candidate division KSB1 bacterium]